MGPRESRMVGGGDTGYISWKRKPLSSCTKKKQFLTQKYKSCVWLFSLTPSTLSVPVRLCIFDSWTILLSCGWITIPYTTSALLRAENVHVSTGWGHRFWNLRKIIILEKNLSSYRKWKQNLALAMCSTGDFLGQKNLTVRSLSCPHLIKWHVACRLVDSMMNLCSGVREREKSQLHLTQWPEWSGTPLWPTAS